MGVLFIAPLILTWTTIKRPVELKNVRAPEIIFLSAALVATTWLSFMSRLPLAYPVYPFVIWTALRFRQRATTLTVAAISVIAIWGTKQGLGPFTNGSLDQEAAGWGWQRAHHPEDYPRVMQDWPRSIATGVPFEIESRIRRSDGTFRWFLMRAEPLRDASGVIARWYGTNTDIDDQKRELQHSTQVAETLQAAYLPGWLPVRPDLRFDALYLTAGREALIGGDWYDAFELPDGHIVVSVGDVVGHGVSAAVTARPNSTKHLRYGV